MNISKLIERCRSITLDNLNFKSFNIGNPWDHSTSKGDHYPCVYFEMPVLTEYSVGPKNSKKITFSLTFLTMAELDNVEDEINMISHLEEYADKFLQYFAEDKNFPLIQSPTGLTLKSVDADVSCGIRIDVQINTGRFCGELCNIIELCP
jgi:hypothetical protein